MYLRLVLLFFSCALIGKAWHSARDGFRIDRCGRLEVSQYGQFSDSQPYRYLASGRQFYAFESLDGRFVAKLPRTDVYRPTLWQRVFSCAETRLARKAFFLESLRIAAVELPEQTALLAITSESTLHLIDRLGRHYTYRGPCVWQRKLSPLVEPTHEAYIALQQAKKTKGIVSKDGSFPGNFGFDGERAYELDVGTFCHIEN